MTSVLDSYLGWEQLQHLADCARPSWEVGIRDEKVYRPCGFGEPPLRHACPDEGCEHGNDFVQTVVRVVCRSCGAAHVITGERTPDTGRTDTSTRHLGYGLPPRRVAGLLLWPGQPWLPVGRAADAEPHDFVVTGPDAAEVTEATVVGQITQGRGKLGGLVWTALAVADPQGPYGFGQRVRWAHANDGRLRGGRPLRTVGAAARWIADRLAEQSGGGQ